ncbi:MAG: hypothetical protein LAO09_00850, partial [Acidobacteriia bacterium]|nr:hypothetical protein [Terriglobia bacterium]
LSVSMQLLQRGRYLLSEDEPVQRRLRRGGIDLRRPNGVLVRIKRDLPEAARLLRRYLANGTVEEAPAFKAHYLLGTLLEKDGDKAAAAQEYRAALALVSSFSPARDALNRLERQSADSTASR